eukprot:scaffold18564_cov69-Phaeocystis_antarctica.AAC.3
MFDESSELRVYSSTIVLPEESLRKSRPLSILSCSSNGARGFCDTHAVAKGGGGEGGASRGPSSWCLRLQATCLRLQATSLSDMSQCKWIVHGARQESVEGKAGRQESVKGKAGKARVSVKGKAQGRQESVKGKAGCEG